MESIVKIRIVFYNNDLSRSDKLLLKFDKDR